jgi:hypothetical protein
MLVIATPCWGRNLLGIGDGCASLHLRIAGQAGKSYSSADDHGQTAPDGIDHQRTKRIVGTVLD